MDRQVRVHRAVLGLNSYELHLLSSRLLPDNRSNLYMWLQYHHPRTARIPIHQSSTQRHSSRLRDLPRVRRCLCYLRHNSHRGHTLPPVPLQARTIYTRVHRHQRTRRWRVTQVLTIRHRIHVLAPKTNCCLPLLNLEPSRHRPLATTQCSELTGGSTGNYLDSFHWFLFLEAALVRIEGLTSSAARAGRSELIMHPLLHYYSPISALYPMCIISHTRTLRRPTCTKYTNTHTLFLLFSLTVKRNRTKSLKLLGNSSARLLTSFLRFNLGRSLPQNDCKRLRYF